MTIGNVSPEEVTRRARLRMTGMGYTDLRSAIAEGLSAPKDGAEVAAVYQQLLRGLVKREALVRACRAFNVPPEFWFTQDEDAVRRMALATLPAPPAEGATR